MLFDLRSITPTWWRRVLMVVVVPPLILIALVIEPVWAGLKMLGELLSSFRELPHTLVSIWRGKRCRYVRRGWFITAGDPY